MLGQSLRLRSALELKAEQKLTATQKLEIKQGLLQLRLDLIGNVHGGSYKPKAQCPKCSRPLTPLEIIQGFRADPNDYTTKCPKCRERFEPRLTWRVGEIASELPFYCSSQVLEKLHGLKDLNPETIQKEHPAVYHSVRVHHGNLRKAFAKIGIQYAYENVTNWKKKVGSFLGKLPDTVIATIVDVPVRQIRSLRRSLAIRPFSQRQLLEEAEE